MKVSVLALSCSAALSGVAIATELKPTDPAAPAPSVSYGSAFADYQPFREEAIADWRSLNDEVGRIGGHKGVMGGAGGHAGHGGAAKSETAKPATGVPTTTESGQTPVRAAPKAPGGGAHTGH